MKTSIIRKHTVKLEYCHYSRLQITGPETMHWLGDCSNYVSRKKAEHILGLSMNFRKPNVEDTNRSKNKKQMNSKLPSVSRQILHWICSPWPASRSISPGSPIGGGGIRGEASDDWPAIRDQKKHRKWAEEVENYDNMKKRWSISMYLSSPPSCRFPEVARGELLWRRNKARASRSGDQKVVECRSSQNGHSLLHFD